MATRHAPLSDRSRESARACWRTVECLELMSQEQLTGMETYQPLQRMLKGFFQLPNNARCVSRVNICAVTSYNFYVLSFHNPLFQTSDQRLCCIFEEPYGGVMWLK